jgi:hypothetical protein
VDPNSSSPALGQGNSPNKRQRLTPPNEFPTGNQMPAPSQPPNGMHAAQQQQGFPPFQNAAMAVQYLSSQGINLEKGTTAQDAVNMARQVYHNNNKQLTAYKQNLVVQQSQQGLATRASLGGASPANQQAQIPFGNPGIPGGMNFAGRDPRNVPTQEQLREMTEHAKQLGGTLQHPSSGSHSLQDYQNQLMVLEQQNKKRLQHARQETNSRNDEPGNAPLSGQFAQHGQGLQPGQQQLQGTSMSPSTSRTGPSPRISNLELQQQQRKPGQKGGSGAASPEPDSVAQMRNPSSAFVGQTGGMTAEQFQQMTQMGGQAFSHPMLMGPNGQPQYMAGRPHPVQFNQAQPMTMEMMKSRMQQQQQQQQQPGQPFATGWPQPIINQAVNQVILYTHIY